MFKKVLKTEMEVRTLSGLLLYGTGGVAWQKTAGLTVNRIEGRQGNRMGRRK